VEPGGLQKEAVEAGLRLVRFLWCGNDGTIRAKATGVRSLASRIESGIGLTVAMQAMNSLDHLQAVEGMGPVGEVRLVPDPASFRVLPYAPRTGAMICDLLDLDGQPAAVSQRSFLKRMIERLAEHGARLEVGFENEFTLATPAEGGGYVPIDSSLCFSTIGLTASQEYAADLVEALGRQSIRVDQFYA
jgi:glutamine synthetase